MFSSAKEKIESVFGAGGTALSGRDAADDAGTRRRGRHSLRGLERGGRLVGGELEEIGAEREEGRQTSPA
jgi:hypothetical protein